MSIEERRSIRKYTNQPVEKAVIEEVIRAAALAPSAKDRPALEVPGICRSREGETGRSDGNWSVSGA